jgi:hypothetical protein
MYTYDAFTTNGLQIHLSMSNNYNTCYIFVNDIYGNNLTMKFFNDTESALAFIQSF